MAPGQPPGVWRISSADSQIGLKPKRRTPASAVSMFA